MKKAKLLFLICAIGALGIMASCSNGGTEEHAAVKKELTPDQRKQQAVFDDYITLKNAFVASNAAAAKQAAQKMTASLKDMPAGNNAGNDSWTKLTSAMNTQLLAIQGSDTLKVQRAAFDSLSSAYYQLAKEFKVIHTTAFHTYCPMAFDEKGAYWISEEDKIKNPYFGQNMLECGEVKDTLQE